MRVPAEALNSVSVIICTYTRERVELLRKAISSVQELVVAPTEVVIVVDHNPELEKELADEFRDVIVVPNNGTRGLSGARNSGIDAASAELLAFLDDDAVAVEGWLRYLTDAFSDSRVMAAGGTVLPAFAVDRPGWWPEEFNWVVGCTYKGQMPTGGTDPFPVRNMIGASMIMRREALEAVGGFNSDLGRVGKVPLGGEETELCIRIGKRFGNRAIQLVPHSVVRHHVPADRLTLRYLHRRCIAEGLSKAVLSRSVGAASGLASETRFLTTTVPKGLLHELGSGLRGDSTAFARAGILLSATITTGLGWIRGIVSELGSRKQSDFISGLAVPVKE